MSYDYDDEYQLAIQISEREYNDIEEKRFQEILKNLDNNSNYSKYTNRNYNSSNKFKNIKKKKNEISIMENGILTQFCDYLTEENINIKRTYNMYKNTNKENLLTQKEWINARKKMICLLCNTKQNISNKCNKCHSKIADFFCSKCLFHSNSKDIIHCDKCNICIYNYENKYFHCDKCNKCISRDHKCQNDNNLNNDCAICQNKICEESPHGNKTTNYITHSKCKNVFHTDCLKEYEKHGGKNCPLCREKLD